MVRTVIIEEAIDLFVAQGYEQTTVEQIATAAGLSRRSFFRYFSSKDDVLTQAMDAAGDQLARALAARPPNEEPWLALRRCFDGLVEDLSTDERSVQIIKVMLEVPALHAAQLQKHSVWRRQLAEVLRERQPADAPVDAGLWADTLSGAALSCLVSAQTAWVSSGYQSPIAQVLDRSMRCLSAE